MQTRNSSVAYYGVGVVSLWNNMLLFTSGNFEMRPCKGFPPLLQLAGGPFRYYRHQWQWSKQPLFSIYCANANGTTTAQNDKEHKGQQTQRIPTTQWSHPIVTSVRIYFALGRWILLCWVFHVITQNINVFLFVCVLEPKGLIDESISCPHKIIEATYRATFYSLDNYSI